ncbi:hypothetical protein KFE25_001779 [Diacronema lutheri]|uniref:Uncharacterized protein n=1 Tax=Diacronema lutheri TaxID=2081491 RepID=A0A8J5XCI5_DIALT|nr:hypothetical protein KFE25_001779 [Diacronema lutheri]
MVGVRTRTHARNDEGAAAAVATGGEDDDAPEELPARVTAHAPRREARVKVPTAVELARAAKARRQEVISTGLRSAGAAAPGALPAEILEAVAGVRMQAKPADERAAEQREEQMAAARRKRAAERRRQAAKLEAALAAERKRVLANPSRVLKTDGHFRLAQLVDEPPRGGLPAARSAPNPAALQFLSSHAYGSRLRRTPSAQAMAEAFAAKQRRQLLAARAVGGAVAKARGVIPRKRAASKQPS